MLLIIAMNTVRKVKIITRITIIYINLTSDIFFGSQWKEQERPPTTMSEGKENIKKSEKALSQADFPKIR